MAKTRITGYRTFITLPAVLHSPGLFWLPVTATERPVANLKSCLARTMALEQPTNQPNTHLLAETTNPPFQERTDRRDESAG
jgi:hypothetical protein